MYWLSLERKKKLSYNRRGLRTTELRNQILNFQSRYQALSPCLPLTREGEGERERVINVSQVGKLSTWKKAPGYKIKKGLQRLQREPSIPVISP